MYFIIEFDCRPDNVINTNTTVRASFASALSLYYDRCSKMVMDTSFVSVSVALVDKDLNIIEHKKSKLNINLKLLKKRNLKRLLSSLFLLCLWHVF